MALLVEYIRNVLLFFFICIYVSYLAGTRYVPIPSTNNYLSSCSDAGACCAAGIAMSRGQSWPRQSIPRGQRHWPRTASDCARGPFFLITTTAIGGMSSYAGDDCDVCLFVCDICAVVLCPKIDFVLSGKLT